MKKKNKLYTANKWNQPLFVDNIFAEGGGIDIQGIGGSVLGDPTKIDLGKIGAMKTPSQGLGLGIGNIAKSGIGIAGNVVGAVGNKLISGGLNSSVGNGIANIGGAIGGAVSTINPVVGGIGFPYTSGLFTLNMMLKSIIAGFRVTAFTVNCVSPSAFAGTLTATSYWLSFATTMLLMDLLPSQAKDSASRLSMHRLSIDTVVSCLII